MQPVKFHDEASALWQKLVLPEEDRRRLFPMTTQPRGYRWWRSANVVDLETYRLRRSKNEASSA
jgi:hypothetical protein